MLQQLARLLLRQQVRPLRKQQYHQVNQLLYKLMAVLLILQLTGFGIPEVAEALRLELVQRYPFHQQQQQLIMCRLLPVIQPQLAGR